MLREDIQFDMILPLDLFSVFLCISSGINPKKVMALMFQKDN